MTLSILEQHKREVKRRGRTWAIKVASHLSISIAARPKISLRQAAQWNNDELAEVIYFLRYFMYKASDNNVRVPSKPEILEICGMEYP